MEVNIAELITIITFLAVCTGYIRRRIKKFEEILTENNRRIEILDGAIAEIDKHLNLLQKFVMHESSNRIKSQDENKNVR